jgi:hypothetical protein
MGDDGSSLTAGGVGLVSVCSPQQRQALIDACDWLIEFEQQSQRDGLLVADEVDLSLDQMSEAKALKQRLNCRGLELAVPLGIVPALIDELAERIEHAVHCKAYERVAELAGLLVQLERLAESDA